MKKHPYHRVVVDPRRTGMLLLCALPGCVVERIDAILAEHGVTYAMTSTGEVDDTASTSTSTGTSTGTDTSTSTGVMTGDTTVAASGEHTGAADSSTGPGGPVCGDGVVEGEETCDDGNATPGDGCQDCAGDSVVFITSEVYQGFALEGLYGADQRCRSLAGKAGLARHLTFKAWLSTPGESATARMVHSRGRYVLVNGLVVAQHWHALTSGALENSISVDEHSETQDSSAWTGTLASGEPALGSEFCEDWQDDSGLLKLAGAGLSLSTDATWSFLEHVPCLAEIRLYCVEQRQGPSP